MNTPEINGIGAVSKSVELTQLGVNIIARMPEFHYLKRAEVANLARRHPKVYKKGETLISINPDEGNLMAILLAGSCKIEAPIMIGDRKINVCVEHVSAPAVFGEVVAFASPFQRRSVNVITARRSIAIVIPAPALATHFEKSHVSPPLMLWSFAMLGLARVRASNAKFNRIIDKYIKARGSVTLGIENEAQRLEKLIGPSPEKAGAQVNEELFDSIAGMFEKVNTALALASYFDQLRDQPFPDDDSPIVAPSTGITDLSRDVLASPHNSGKSIKQAVADTIANRRPPHRPGGEWKPFLEKMIAAAEDILGLASEYYVAHDRRRTPAGANAMIDGFVQRMEREMDAALEDAKERFDIPQSAAQLDDAPNLERIASFFQSRMDAVMIRDWSQNIITAGQDEFIREQAHIRDHAAIELYHRLSRHPVLRVVMRNICESKKMCPKTEDASDKSLLDLFCIGCRLIYPPVEGDNNVINV